MEIIPHAGNHLNYKYHHQYYISVYQEPEFNKWVMHLVDYILYIFVHKYDYEALSPCLVKLFFALILQKKKADIATQKSDICTLENRQLETVFYRLVYPK